MEQVSYQFILGISGSLIILLLGIVAFFLKRFIDEVVKLQEVVQQLHINTTTEKGRADTFWLAVEQKHNIIDHRLNDHSKKLGEHSLHIERHETEIKELRRR